MTDERRVGLAVKQARGRRLGESETRWLAEQYGADPLATREAEVLAEFANLEQPRPDQEMSDEAMLEAVLERAASGGTEAGVPRTWRWAVGGLLAAGLLLALGWRLRTPAHEDPDSSQASAPLPSTPESPTPRTTDGDGPSPSGDVTPPEPRPPTRLAINDSAVLDEGECIALTDLRVCARSDGTTVQRRPPDAEGRSEIELGSGALRAHASSSSQGIRISTTVGSIYTKVGAFSAELDVVHESKTLVVEVSEGTVMFSDGKRPPRPIDRGRRWSPPRNTEKGRKVSPAPSPVLDPSALLKLAQDQLANEQRAAASKTYAQLIEQFPQAREARVAKVSLGRIRLAQGRATAALDLFDDYLSHAKGPGPLTVDARYERIRALRALGRTRQELAAIEDFLARHDDSIYATRLRERQEQLR